MISPDQMKRLRFARFLLHQAAEHARVDHDSRNAACVTSLQDCVETILLVIGEHINANIPPRSDFDKYFAAINEKVKGYELPFHQIMLRLNRLRVQAKHSGIFPSHAQSSAMVPVVAAFAEEVCQRLLDVDWRTANLSTLVTNEEQRTLLAEAEEALSERRFVDALVAARKAMFVAFEKPYDISRFASGKPLGLLGMFGCEAPSWAQSPEYVSAQVSDPFGYIVIDHAGLDSKLFKLGIDPMSFWNVWRIAPAVYQLEDKRWIAKRELNKVERTDHEGDAIYVVETVTEMILRREENDRRLKMIPHNLWQLVAKPGAIVYSKTDRSSAPQFVFEIPTTVTVVSETVGFDGVSEWWQVHWFGGGQMGSGYLLEEDVDRTIG